MQGGFRVPRAPGREIPRKMALFPTKSTNISHMRTEYNYPELKDLYGRQDIYPFIIYLDKEIVYIKKVGWTDKMVANLDRLAKDAGGRTIDPSKTSWNTVARTLSRDSKTAQYCDRRQCYVFNNNYFLVKSGFTFGQKTVPPGTMHLIQTTHRPLHLYLLPPRGRNRIRIQDRLLAVKESRFYEHVLLKSDTAYRVAPNTTYVMIASQKAYFSLHVLPEYVLIPFETIDPTDELRQEQQDRRREFQYNIPPPTPNMLDEERAPQPDDEMPPPYETIYPIHDPELHDPDVQIVEPQRQQPEPQPQPQQPPPQPQQPPPQPQVLQPIIVNYEYPLERRVKIVHPDLIKWYQSLKQTYGPNEFFIADEYIAENCQTEALDLISKGPRRKKKSGNFKRHRDFGEYNRERPVSPLQQPVSPLQQPVSPLQQPQSPSEQSPLQQPVSPSEQSPLQQPVSPSEQPVSPLQQPPSEQPVSPSEQSMSPLQQPPSEQSMSPLMPDRVIKGIKELSLLQQPVSPLRPDRAKKRKESPLQQPPLQQPVPPLRPDRVKKRKVSQLQQPVSQLQQPPLRPDRVKKKIVKVSPLQQPVSPFQQPESPFQQPESPSEQSESPSEQSESPLQQPVSPLLQPVSNEDEYNKLMDELHELFVKTV